MRDGPLPVSVGCMKDRPTDLDEPALLRALAEWGLADARLTYAPIGFDDYHWIATDTQDRPGQSERGRWFVTVADLAHKDHCGVTTQSALRGLRQAMDTAAALGATEGEAPDAGLDFVVPPLLTASGDTVRPLGPGGRYAVSVFPYVPGVAGSPEQSLTTRQRGPVLDLLATLHSTKAPPSTPVLSPELTARARLEDALSEVCRQPAYVGAAERAAAPGPYAEPVRALLARHAVGLRGRLDEFDRLVTELSRSAARLVVTHGEPHPGNLLWPEADGNERAPDAAEQRPLLIDWDTVGLAVPERDLWSVAQQPADFARYTAATGRTPDAFALALYALRWDLEDLTAYLGWFRSPHGHTPDTAAGWAGLTDIVSRLTGTRA